MNEKLEEQLPHIIKASSDLIGLSEKDLSSLLNKNISFEELKKEKLSIESYQKITDFYYLTEIDIFSSYNQDLQINRICNAIMENSYKHKIALSVRKHYRVYKKQRWKNENSYYGFRLRWQTRINRTFNTNIRLPSIEDISPFWLRKIVHKVKKTLNLCIHILKNSSYEHFCYYDTRYDKKEECNSNYYFNLYNRKNEQLN